MPTEENNTEITSHLQNKEQQKNPPLTIKLGRLCEPAIGKTQEQNEDTVLICKRKPMLAVFDGIGGEAAGEEASQSASKKILEFQPPSDDGIIAVYEAIKEAHKAVLERRQQLVNQGLIGKDEFIGTTATVAYFSKDKNGNLQVTIGSIGDSRAYVLRNKELIQLTIDQNILTKLKNLTNNEIKKIQQVLNNMVNPEEVRLDSESRAILTKIYDYFIKNIKKFGLPETDQGKIDPALSALLILFNKRNLITNYLGNPNYPNDIPCPVSTHTLQPGDVLLLCTDGLSDNLTDREIAEILASAETAKDAAQELFQKAKDRYKTTGHPRAKIDDIGLIVACII